MRRMRGCCSKVGGIRRRCRWRYCQSRIGRSRSFAVLPGTQARPSSKRNGDVRRQISNHRGIGIYTIAGAETASARRDRCGATTGGRRDWSFEIKEIDPCPRPSVALGWLLSEVGVMSDPATGVVVRALDTVLKLWDRGVALLLALFGICFTLLSGAACAWWLGAPDYLSSYGLYLVVGAVIFGGLAFARLIARAIERRAPSFHFIPDDAQSLWHIAKQPDGKIHTQISLRFQTTNMARRGLMPSKAILKRPFLWGSHPNVIIATENRPSGLYSRYNMIPAGLTRNVQLEFFVPKKIGKAGSPLDVKVVIEPTRTPEYFEFQARSLVGLNSACPNSPQARERQPGELIVGSMRTPTLVAVWVERCFIPSRREGIRNVRRNAASNSF
jgi:hypothetical protein